MFEWEYDCVCLALVSWKLLFECFMLHRKYSLLLKLFFIHRYNIYHLEDGDDISSIFLPSVTIARMLDDKLTSDERSHYLFEYLKKKRGMRNRFLTSDQIFLPFYHNNHWYLYILYNPSNVKNNYSRLKNKLDAKTMLVLMDSFDSTADPNPHVLSMFCFMLNFYISDDMDAVNPVIREDQIPYVHVKNLPVNIHGLHCSTHVSFWML